MADKSSIEWTDATWNPITGCSVVSPGCTNCYAMRLAGTRMKHHPSRIGLTDQSKAGPVWNGQVRLNEQWLDQPLRWRKPRRIFVCAHGDLFHESVPDEWIDRVFAVMALAPQHTFQVLTKRASRARDYLHGDAPRRWVMAYDPARFPRDLPRVPEVFPQAPLPNVWLGVSAEDQQRADERVSDLLATPAAVRFVSAEPLLGQLDLAPWLQRGDHGLRDVDPLAAVLLADGKESGNAWVRPALDWVIVGGESGPGARPMHPDWVRSLRDQCAEAGVAFHFKQHGEWIGEEDLDSASLLAPQQCDPNDYLRHHDFPDGTRVWKAGKKAAGRSLDWKTWDQIPDAVPCAGWDG